MNFLVRFRNRAFWLGFIPAVIGIVYMVLGIFDIVPKISENYLIEIGGLIVSALSGLGVLIDPTTSGIRDSQQAMTYEVPREDERED